MKKVEYEFDIFTRPTLHPQLFVQWLNEHGQSGWELCYTQDVTPSMPTRVCVFKRVIENKIEHSPWQCRGCGMVLSHHLLKCPNCGVNK